jgi:hypothetical protein
MVAKLIEMLHTGKLRQAEEARTNGRSDVVAELMGVWGAGRANCNRWFEDGVRSLSDLRRRTAEGSMKLTDNQMVGAGARDFGLELGACCIHIMLHLPSMPGRATALRRSEGANPKGGGTVLAPRAILPLFSISLHLLDFRSPSSNGLCGKRVNRLYQGLRCRRWALTDEGQRRAAISIS